MAAAPLAPSRGAEPRPPQPLVWRLQALLSSYLPLLLMAFLASGTWWLVKSTPSTDDPTEAAPLRHEPDYQMQGFELQRIAADGLLRVRIEGTELRHYPDNDTMEIDGIRLRAVGADGSVTLARASRALSNGDGSELQLMGSVQVQRFEGDGSTGEPKAAPQLVVRGEFLQVLANSEQLRSHLPVQINYAGGELQAQSFEFDHVRGLMKFSGRTTGRFDTVRAAAAKKP
jgi:lipopolysaccharide export system protein LptC